MEGSNIPDKIIYTDIYESKKTVNNNITLNPYKKQLTTSNVIITTDNVIEVNDIKYEIDKITNNGNNIILDINNLRKDSIDLIIEKSETLFARQIFYVNSDLNFTYKYFDNLGNETDNMKVLSII